jgi:hypothetical protein
MLMDIFSPQSPGKGRDFSYKSSLLPFQNQQVTFHSIPENQDKETAKKQRRTG